MGGFSPFPALILSVKTFLPSIRIARGHSGSALKAAWPDGMGEHGQKCLPGEMDYLLPMSAPLRRIAKGTYGSGPMVAASIVCTMVTSLLLAKPTDFRATASRHCMWTTRVSYGSELPAAWSATTEANGPAIHRSRDLSATVLAT